MKQVPIVYFFQNEPKTQFMFFFQGEELIVKNIIQQFPFKFTTHYIRFKIFVQDIEPKTYAWYDISNPNTKVPVINDTVFVKILTLKDLSYCRIAKIMVDSVCQNQKVEDLRTQKIPVQQSQQRKDGEDLFKFDGSTQSISQQQSNNQYEGLRDKQIVNLRVEQATEGLHKIWQEDANFNVLRQKAKEDVEPKILKWAYKNNVRNNLRLLLSSLTDVLWEGTGWSCSIGDLMTDIKVKLKYRQALLIVHPDKHNQTPSVQRYIAERVLYELNQAWNEEKSRG